jgi:hypothetical protein
MKRLRSIERGRFPYNGALKLKSLDEIADGKVVSFGTANTSFWRHYELRKRAL